VRRGRSGFAVRQQSRRDMLYLKYMRVELPRVVTTMDVFFVDDAGQPKSSRPGTRPLLAAGAIALMSVLRGANLGDGGLTARK